MSIRWDEFHEIVDANPTGFITSFDPERGPEAMLVPVVATADGYLLLDTRARSRTAHNIAADGRVALVIGLGDTSYQVEGVAQVPVSERKRKAWTAAYDRRFPGRPAPAEGSSVVRILPNRVRRSVVAGEGRDVEEGRFSFGFVPDDFEAPTSLIGDGFRLEPLGPQHNDADLAAWTSSVSHIRATPGFPDGDWPPVEGMSAEENLMDLTRHAADFAAATGFTFTVLNLAADVVGCVYLYPSGVAGHDVDVQSWVRADRAELDDPLADALARWLKAEWPWQRPNRFGRPEPRTVVAPVLDDRRQRVEKLLTLLGDHTLTSAVPDACRQVASAVDPAALARHVNALARVPRHALIDERAARAAGNYAAAELRATGLSVIELPATVEGVTHTSYVGTVPGSGEDARAVVLVAHYDTVEGSPGADDNASGVAAALEIARVLPRGELPADVLVAVVPFEEHPGGLAGSRTVARWLKEQGRDVIAAISAEMVGFATPEPRVQGDRGDDLLLVGYPGTADVIATLVGVGNSINHGSMRGLALPAVLPEVERSDHRAFHDEGWPAVMATDGAEFRNPHYHGPSDTPETIDAAFHLRAAQGLAAGLIALVLR